MVRWSTLVFATLLAIFYFGVQVDADDSLERNEGDSSKRSAAESEPSRLHHSTRRYSREIDAIIDRHLSARELKRNPAIDDATFLRRAYLSIIGRIPNIEEVESFLDSDSSQKRTLLIDELLDSYGHVSHQFNFWADILRLKTRLNNAPGDPYIDFVKDSLESNKPYDDFVRELLAAEGPLLERGNGAVGYYLRDRNMPEDNMSNTVRVFLGTRLECAQCHDHPFDKWTQRQYFEMVAFTGGMNYRIENDAEMRRQYRELQKDSRIDGKKIDGNVAAAVRRLLRSTTAGITGGGTGLARLPETYEGPDGAANEIVTAKTMFDGKPIVDVQLPPTTRNAKKQKKNRKYGQRIRGAKEVGSRKAYAEWLTDLDNPRFSKVIANRLWKQAFGIGLVEPVDVIEDSTIASNPELLDYLTDVMIEIDFDMREFQRIIYNTKTWQSEVTRKDIPVIQKYDFPGPVMRRMSAEQLWDSMVGLTVDAIDRRSAPESRIPGFGKTDKYEFYEKIKDMSLAEVYEFVANKGTNLNQMMQDSNASAKREAKNQRKAIAKKLEEINRQVNQSRRAGDRERMRQLLVKRTDIVSRARSSSQNTRFKRASELPSPAPAKHLLREFGQSDRETIENANRDPAVTQVLRLMNGFVDDTIGNDPNSVMTRNVLMADDEEEAIEAVFMTMLCRKPTKSELRVWTNDFKRDSRSSYTDLVWTLINSNEFIFVR